MGRTFGCVWEPCYRNGSRNLLAPVRVDGSWTIAENGSPIWDSRFMQLWNQRLSPDGRRLAAVAAPGFGSWTVVVDDKAWKPNSTISSCRRFSLRRPPCRGRVRDKGEWSVAVDDTAGPRPSTWSGTRFSPPTAIGSRPWWNVRSLCNCC